MIIQDSITINDMIDEFIRINPTGWILISIGEDGSMVVNSNHDTNSTIKHLQQARDRIISDDWNTPASEFDKRFNDIYV
jgi:hypothetical protein